MSMPSYPEHGADLTREQALTMVVASIAMEEQALSSIMDAEGEKLRTVVRRLEECGCLRDVLAANESVTKLLEVVMQNQLLLRSKLALALECGCRPEDGPAPCPPPCPPERPPHTSCPPPCPPPCRQKGAAQLSSPCGQYLWKGGCPLRWECCRRIGDAVRWNGDAPALVELDPDRGYAVSCQINLCDFLPTEASGRIQLETGDCCAQPPPLFFSICCPNGEAATLQYTALLLPRSGKSLSLRLHARGALCVSQAVMNIQEL